MGKRRHSANGQISKLVWAIHTQLDDPTKKRNWHTPHMFAVDRKLVDQIPDITNDDAHFALQSDTKGYRVKRILRRSSGLPTEIPRNYIVQRSRNSSTLS